VQDPVTAAYASMPTSAIATGCVDLILPPRVLGPAIVALVMSPGASRFFSVPTPYSAQPVLAD